MPQARVLILAGSLSSMSACSRLAASFMRELAFLDAAVTYVALADYPMPLYDPDLEPDVPVNARKLAAFFRANHAVFVVSADAGGSLAPALANALNWIAAASAELSGASICPFFALGVASNGNGPGSGQASGQASGSGAGALSHLRDLVAGRFGAVIVGGIGIAGTPAAFDERGGISDPHEAKALQRLARDTVFMARRLAVEP